MDETISLAALDRERILQPATSIVDHLQKGPRIMATASGMTEVECAASLASDLVRLIVSEGPGTVAAFIAEPVMGAGGVLVPPEAYFEEVQKVLRKHDVLMMADEVICGFGRLGRWFGSELYGIGPDLLTAAKGLTSGYFPLSACFISEKICSYRR